MKIDIRPIGYKFRVATDTGVFYLISKTELGMSESNEMIRKFFENFRIIKSETVEKSEETMISENIIDICGEVNTVERPIMKHIRKRETIKDIWDNLRDLFGNIFTMSEYKQALKDSGYEYTTGSWDVVPTQQIGKLVEFGIIEKIEGSRPTKYRKIKVPILKNG